ncbi:putative lipid II flippase FtsW [Methylococcus sp. Mc7]|uniref:putative lipid II flippase FtsW n=1 Tax=Methylococcus sp. Mc7 TaxID=2860258 RepID=UPI001C530FED|nr:putative lipid II flippase FtsW [Methylococcus sp. Mc7]QXP84829.1 putative lipid II flippase FtsW [Methylococcus sp. Mc7]
MTTQAIRGSRGLVLKWGAGRFYLDTILLSVSLALMLFGFVMVSSASLHLGEKMASDSFYFPKHQLAHIVLGLAAGWAAAKVRLDPLERHSRSLFWVGIALLVLVLIPGVGKSVNGSVRWINLFGLRVQVSEVFKLVAAIYVAGYISRHLETVRTSVKGMLFPLSLLSIGAVLLLKEPDFGATAVVMATALGMLFLAGARLWVFASLLGLVAFAGTLLIFTAEYRLKRVLSFLDPWADPLNSGFQLTQALIAFGRGEWQGVGLGSSVQKLFYLPEAHTDFLFSVIGEELGLWGATTVILLFAVVVWRALAIGRLAERSGKLFAAFLAYGIGLWLGLQSFINMGVNMGMLPTKGLTLPLMSYGGGSMMVVCAAIGLLFRIRSEVVASFLGNGRKGVWPSA